jgi:methylated-DNA-[protein]-cysteine S-methyltransferase
MKSFTERCYDTVRQIPKGKVSTYKDVANAMGSSAVRAVGTAMKKNSDKITPCHRVINSNGFVGGYNGLIGDKIEALKKEGVEVVEGLVNLKKFGFEF